MALFGKVDTLKHQVGGMNFSKTFEYLEKVLRPGSTENDRLLSMSMGDTKKKYLDESIFALEQVYMTRDRTECVYESHRDYIDVQLIVDGSEFIEVINVERLDVNMSYNKNTDVFKYDDNNIGSVIRLEHGDVAIFYPNDAHMPCLKIEDERSIVKTVVKIPL